MQSHTKRRQTKEILSQNMLSKLTVRFHHITRRAGILRANEALNQNCIQGALSLVIGKLNYNCLNSLMPSALTWISRRVVIFQSLVSLIVSSVPQRPLAFWPPLDLRWGRSWEIPAVHVHLSSLPITPQSTVTFCLLRVSFGGTRGPFVFKLSSLQLN